MQEGVYDLLSLPLQEHGQTGNDKIHSIQFEDMIQLVIAIII